MIIGNLNSIKVPNVFTDNGSVNMCNCCGCSMEECTCTDCNCQCCTDKKMNKFKDPEDYLDNSTSSGGSGGAQNAGGGATQQGPGA